ncbi:MAG TPA: molybdopterin-dependent oxidoreductase [Candidatus Limnocylindrales bacterium]|nr:molybdopterin-dependent oxidoreductase [Candidatus Limnocylindrales bacterium]
MTGRGRTAFTGGAIGGSAALLILLLARIDGGSPGILEVVADAVVRLIPPALFDWGIKTLGPSAKGVLVAGVCLGVPLAGGVVAAVSSRLGSLDRRGALVDAAVLAAAAFMVGEFVVLPLTGVGVAGMDLVSQAPAVHLPLLAASLTYGAVTAAYIALERRSSDQDWDPMGGPGFSPARRSFVVGSLRLVGLGSLIASGLVVVARIVPPARLTLPGQVDPASSEGFGFVRAVTPEPEFYVVSKDWVPMTIDAETWRLNVDGLVEEPRAWTLSEIAALPTVEGYRTLQCISAESITRSTLIGNQRWKGARVRDLLAAARPGPGARYVLWRCADGYHESLDLETARRDDTWLVYEMGPLGTSLTPEHGHPLRLLVAGRYGMAQPKYLTDMILSARDEPGWWVKGGWQTDAPVRTYCRIDLPAADGISDSVLAGRAFTAYGVASSGDRGISAVQISLDRGASWLDAELEPLGGPIGRLTWVRWRAEVRLDEPGQVLFMARAADGTGRWQTDEVSEPFPNGASGYPRVPMRVYAGLGEPD